MTAIAIFGLATTTIAQVPSYVPTNGLAGWWPFNGNANDESGNGNNGTVNGATLTADRFGNTNKAYGFDGVDDYLVTQNSGPLGNSNRSISIWFNSVNSNVSQIFGYGYQPPSGGEFNLLLNQLCAGITIDVHNNYITYNTINLTDGNWHNVVCVYNNTVSANILGVSFFVDGILLSNSSCQNPITVNVNTLNTSLNFGRYQAGALYFNGSLDDIGIWNRALTECEIQDLYHAQLNSASQSISAGADQSICAGDNVTLNGTGGSNYLWNNNVVDGQAFAPAQSNAYVVTAQDTLGCTGTDTVVVTVLENATSTLTETALDSYTLNGQTYTESGTYTQTIPSVNGCDSVINLNLTLNFTGLSQEESTLFVLYPNPASEQITIKTDAGMIGKEYALYNQVGKLITKGKLTGKNTSLSLQGLARGLYSIAIEGQEKKSFTISKE